MDNGRLRVTEAIAGVGDGWGDGVFIEEEGVFDLCREKRYNHIYPFLAAVIPSPAVVLYIFASPTLHQSALSLSRSRILILLHAPVPSAETFILFQGAQGRREGCMFSVPSLNTLLY